MINSFKWTSGILQCVISKFSDTQGVSISNIFVPTPCLLSGDSVIYVKCKEGWQFCKHQYSCKKNGKTQGRGTLSYAQDFTYTSWSQQICTWHKVLQYFCLLQVVYVTFSSGKSLIENLLHKIYCYGLIKANYIGRFVLNECRDFFFVELCQSCCNPEEYKHLQIENDCMCLLFC